MVSRPGSLGRIWIGLRQRSSCTSFFRIYCLRRVESLFPHHAAVRKLDGGPDR